MRCRERRRQGRTDQFLQPATPLQTPAVSRDSSRFAKPKLSLKLADAGEAAISKPRIATSVTAFFTGISLSCGQARAYPRSTSNASLFLGIGSSPRADGYTVQEHSL